MLSPSVSVTTPEGGGGPTTSRRRGLSYLRGLSQNRLTATSPSEKPKSSPRSYFSRSISYNEPRSRVGHTARRRSASRTREHSAAATPEPHEPEATGSPDLAASAPDRPNLGPRAQTDSQREPSTSEAAPASDSMARQRNSSRRTTTASSATETHAPKQPSEPQTANPQTSSDPKSAPLPMLRLFPHQEMRNGRQSLNFPPVTRTLPNESCIIRVGRYSEREGIPSTNPTVPSDAPVGFKSKVVSRKHCEFSFVDGEWQIKDVASSSGTFLNHIRLSQPNTESRLFPVKDGDIVQLGIDFRGGEEMIFRCVKIRIECNRSWQKRPNNFNKTRHAQLQSLSKDQPTAGENNGECSICLGSVLPCQSLFVAPCAHVWHYKCIRPMLEGKNSTYPQFQCPNCRAYTDLSAEVDVAEEDLEEWMDAGDESAHNPDASVEGEVEALVTRPNVDTSMMENAYDDDMMGVEPATEEGGAHLLAVNPPTTPSLTGSQLLSRRQAANPASPEIASISGIDMPDRFPPAAGNELEVQRTLGGTPDPEAAVPGEGPMTPRNNAGPFVFDGSAGRPDARRLTVPDIGADS